MKWLYNFFVSSIGRKLIMSLTGLFLILFLITHLAGNLQLLVNDNGVSFNVYSKFMSENFLIQAISKFNFFFILLHAVQGIMMALANKKAKGSKYGVTPKNKTSWASKNMALLGTLILAFILMHLGHFWFAFKYGSGHTMITIDNVEMIDFYSRVVTVFTNPIWVAAYVIGLIVLALHLNHGFQSAFQTLGINHKKYTPIIAVLGKIYAFVIPLLFAIIPLYYFFVK